MMSNILMKTRVTFFLGLIILSFGNSIAKSSEPSDGVSDGVYPICIPEKFCELQGTLDIIYPGYPLWGAVLYTSEGCVQLLLPPEYFDEDANWSDQEVELSGMAHEQPHNPNVLRYEFDGRQYMPGACDSLAFVYVEEMRRTSH